MKKLRSGSFVVVLFTIFFISTLSAHAALELRGTDSLGNRLIYDTGLDVTWYDYTSAINKWQNQVNWASGLTVDFGGTIYDDWRLPTVTDTGNNGCNFAFSGTDCGFNVNTGTGEMAHLFYTELGNKGYYDTSGNPQTGWGLTNKGDFQHLQQGYYWSGTEFVTYSGYAWFFNTGQGNQNGDVKSSYSYGIAVRPGDVSVAVAPEPMSMVLFGAGGVVLAARKKLLRRRGKHRRCIEPTY